MPAVCKYTVLAAVTYTYAGVDCLRYRFQLVSLLEPVIQFRKVS
jgi:hypothetical protein